MMGRRGVLVYCAVMLSVSLMSLAPSAHAANCAIPSPVEALAAPQLSFLRSYPHDFRSPLRLAVDAADSVYVVDPQKGEVVVRAADGRVTDVIRGLGRPGGLALDPAGNFYIADLDSARVTLFDGNWSALNSFDSGVLRVGDIALDAGRSRLYISDSEGHRIRVFSTAGTWLFDIGSEGEGDAQFLFPSGLFFDAARDELLVSDQFSYRVQLLDADGVFKFCIGGSSANPGSFFQRGRSLLAPQGLSVDSIGRIYVADSFAGQVKVFDRNARLLSNVGAFGQAGGELRIPSDVVIDSAGRLFVASSNNARLEVFGLDAFTDPEAFTPALLALTPTLIDPEQGDALQAIIRAPALRLADIDLASLRLNDVPPLSASLQDSDRDGEVEIVASFEVVALLPTLPSFGSAQLVLSASTPVLPLHAVGRVQIASADADLDGVADDADACPGTLAGELVDAAGCAVAQVCPCADFNSHGKYVKCVNRAARRFQDLPRS
jgi:DNA-binding beta-propeller fold protein YncE